MGVAVVGADVGIAEAGDVVIGAAVCNGVGVAVVGADVGIAEAGVAVGTGERPSSLPTSSGTSGLCLGVIEPPATIWLEPPPGLNTVPDPEFDVGVPRPSSEPLPDDSPNRFWSDRLLVPVVAAASLLTTSTGASGLTLAVMELATSCLEERRCEE